MILTISEIDDVVVFNIEGDFRRSEANEPSLSGIVKAQLEERKKKLLINLEKVGLMDSFGVAEILTSHVSVQNQGGKLKVAAIPWKRLGGYPKESPPQDFLYSSMEEALADFRAARKSIKNRLKSWQPWRRL